MSVSVLNTTAGISGKTLVIAESPATITGLFNYNRGTSAPFAVNSGAAKVSNLDADLLDGLEGAAFLLLAGGTMTGDLKATDNLYDIGKSGATRFRDFFLSRNAVIGGTLGVTGVATLTAQAVLSAGFKTTLENCYIGDDANANMTLGLTINQGTATNEILALKGSNIAHGMTTPTETDTFAYFSRYDGTNGGLTQRMYTADDLAWFVGAFVVNQNATRSTSGRAPIFLTAGVKSGTSTTGMTADKNMFIVADSSAGTRFILDSDGDSFQDVGTAWTNFDSEDDIKILDAVAVSLAREGDPLREEFVRHFESRRSLIESLPGKRIVHFNDDGHHFVNMSRLTMVHSGAIRQLANRIATIERKLLAA